MIVALGGDMIRPALAEARAAFRAAAARGVDVILDLAAVARMDAAFLGLVLMLEKHVVRNGRALYVDGADRKQLAFLRANAMDYPQSPRGAAGQSPRSAAVA